MRLFTQVPRLHTCDKYEKQEIYRLAETSVKTGLVRLFELCLQREKQPNQ